MYRLVRKACLQSRTETWTDPCGPVACVFRPVCWKGAPCENHIFPNAPKQDAPKSLPDPACLLTVPLLVDPNASDLPFAVRKHLEALEPAPQYASAWRDAIPLEHLFVSENAKCVANCSTLHP